MLKIRAAQMQKLGSSNSGSFEDRLVSFLQEEFDDARDEPRLELKAAVGGLVEKARTYELTTEQQIATYVTCAWLLGQDFDTEFPAAEEMLSSPYSPEDKATWLSQWTEAIFETLRQED